MKIKRRIIKRGPDIEVRVSIVFSKKELEGASDISSDPYVGLEPLRSEELSVFWSYLRLLCHWIEIWNDRKQYKKYIPMWRANRLALESRVESKKKRRRRK